ncbi:hypothetical protein FHU10_4049 [Serratia fonticola]|uniref:Uncharacterized protein n=1 Tax=Serratia fonticola TaxID=47917 RepID=A0A559T9Y9_SERFO|nr:hypothetical protein FHU09_3656 [Serratia fonticola]TQI96927.1 hypothetical protein FHU11_2389 [Serratia fonticola]TVZ71422.1 hypothetical protein FHU10_4049 [Serratia fonticola]
MVKSLVGLQRINNRPYLISRCHEGSLSDSQFLTKSWLLFRNFPADTHSYFEPTTFSCEKTLHLRAGAYSRHPSAKGGQNLIRV